MARTHVDVTETSHPILNQVTPSELRQTAEASSHHPAFVDQRIQELLLAFEAEWERNEAIWDAVLKLGIDLAEYFKAKKIALSPEVIAIFAQNIGNLHLSPTASTRLFSHMGIISRLHDEAVLAFGRKRNKDKKGEDNDGDNDQRAAEEPISPRRRSTLPFVTIDPIYQVPNIEGARIAQAFYLAGEFLRNLNDGVQKSGLLLEPSVEIPQAAEILEVRTATGNSARTNDIQRTKAALITYGQQLLAHIRQDADPEVIMRHFILLLAHLPSTESKISELATDTELTQILGELREHKDIFKQLRKAVKNLNTHGNQDIASHKKTVEHLKNCVTWLSRLLERPQWYENFTADSQAMLQKNVALSNDALQEGYPRLAWHPTESHYEVIDSPTSAQKLVMAAFTTAEEFRRRVHTRQKSGSSDSASSSRSSSPASESLSNDEEYVLHLMEIQAPKDSKMEEEEEASFIFEEMTRQRAQIPTLVKFHDAYYLYGISQTKKEPIKAALRLIETARNPILLAELQILDFRRSPETSSTIISNYENPKIYKKILSLKNDHSLLPALLNHYVPALISACEAPVNQKDRYIKIAEAFVSLAHGLYPYLKRKNLAGNGGAGAEAIERFIQNISIHPLFENVIALLSNPKNQKILGLALRVITEHKINISSNEATVAQLSASEKPDVIPGIKPTRILNLAALFLMNLATPLSNKLAQEKKEQEINGFQEALIDVLPVEIFLPSIEEDNKIKAIIKHAKSLTQTFRDAENMEEKTRYKKIVADLIQLSPYLWPNQPGMRPNLSEDEMAELAASPEAQQAFEALSEFKPVIEELYTAITHKKFLKILGEKIAPSKIKTQSQLNNLLRQFNQLKVYIALIKNIVVDHAWEKPFVETLENALQDPMSPTSIDCLLEDALQSSSDLIDEEHASRQKPLIISKIFSDAAHALLTFLHIVRTILTPIAVVQHFIPISKKKGGWIVVDIFFFPFLSPDKIIEKYKLNGTFGRLIYSIFWLGLAGVSPMLLNQVGVTILTTSIFGFSPPVYALMLLGMFLYLSLHLWSSSELHNRIKLDDHESTTLRVENMRLLAETESPNMSQLNSPQQSPSPESIKPPVNNKPFTGFRPFTVDETEANDLLNLMPPAATTRPGKQAAPKETRQLDSLPPSRHLSENQNVRLEEKQTEQLVQHPPVSQETPPVTTNSPNIKEQQNAPQVATRRHSFCSFDEYNSGKKRWPTTQAPIGRGRMAAWDDTYQPLLHYNLFEEQQRAKLALAATPQHPQSPVQLEEPLKLEI
ncbi:MAG: hypothetical protein K0Q74_1348 [Gammaproteobacteria bacterium]|jgi:hypothetical protein|nr:hypothetical protein [Gammaproteobacteria bacterium]